MIVEKKELIKNVKRGKKKIVVAKVESLLNYKSLSFIITVHIFTYIYHIIYKRNLTKYV